MDALLAAAYIAESNPQAKKAILLVALVTTTASLVNLALNRCLPTKSSPSSLALEELNLDDEADHPSEKSKPVVADLKPTDYKKQDASDTKPDKPKDKPTHPDFPKKQGVTEAKVESKLPPAERHLPTIRGTPDSLWKIFWHGGGDINLENSTTQDLHCVLTDAPLQKVLNKKGEIDVPFIKASLSTKRTAGRPICERRVLHGLKPGEAVVPSPVHVGKAGKIWLIAAWKEEGWLYGKTIHVICTDRQLRAGETMRFQARHADKKHADVKTLESEKDWDALVEYFTTTPAAAP